MARETILLIAGLVCCCLYPSALGTTPVYLSIIDTKSNPFKPYRADLTLGAGYLAIDHINNRSDVLPDHELVPVLNIVPVGNPGTEPVKVFTDVWTNQREQISAFFGPPLSTEAVYPGLLAAYSDLPFLSWVSTDSRYLDTSEYSTFIRTTGDIRLIGGAIVEFMDFFSWDRIAYIEFHDGTHLSTINALRTYILPALDAAGKQVFSNLEANQYDDIEFTLGRASSVARVIFVSFFLSSYTSQILDAIQTLNLDNGEYVVMIYVTSPDRFDFAFVDEATTASLLDALKTVIVFTEDTLVHTNSELYNLFLQEAFERSLVDPLNFTISAASDQGSFAAYMYDLVKVYAYGLHNAIQDGYSPHNGSAVVQYTRNVTFDGASGLVQFGEDGQRRLPVSIFTLANSSTGWGYSRLYGSRMPSEANLSRILWPGNATSAPSDSPPCGWDNEYCPVQEAIENNDLFALTSLLIILLVAAVVSVVIIHLYWKNKQEKHCRRQYQINFDDLVFGNAHTEEDSTDILSENGLPSKKFSTGYTFSGVFGKLSHTGTKLKRKQTYGYSCAGTQTVSRARYKNQDVVVKSLQYQAKLTDSIAADILRVLSLKHKNILEIHGVSQSSLTYVVMPYVSHKSIKDILESKSVMPPDVELHMLRDICQAMIYLHNISPIGVHGNLKSSNCMVGSRWDVKVSDIQPCSLMMSSSTMKMCTAVSVRSIEDIAPLQIEKFAWTAPEILRKIGTTAVPPCKLWSKPADVYSFGIIMQELLLKGKPFCQNTETSLIQSIVRIAKPLETIHRPRMPANCEPIGCTELAQDCWDEDPSKRPTFTAILQRLEIIYPKILDTNVMDTLMDRMAKYAEKLQAAVQERTAEVSKEKEKCDELLSKMLPRNVIATLKQGQPVRSEQFDETTVCFTAISDFSDIAVQSNPLEIVTFLNKLYVTFDKVIETMNVYKVETIGDTYMLVAGLPNRLHWTHAELVARSALALMEASKTFVIPHMPESKLQLRIGIHSGPVVAGVTGSAMPRYCLFGDTVNTSSRMQSTGESHKIQISPTTYLLLWKLGNFLIQQRGPVFVKGKGDINTFWLIGENPCGKEEDPNTLMLTKAEVAKLSNFTFLPLWLQQMGVKLK